MMIWYTRHQYLEGLNRHDSYSSWHSDVRERKSTAITRAWPAPTGNSMPDGEILFIHDALLNLDTQPEEYTPDRDYEQAIAFLQKDENLSFSRAKVEGLVGSYPFKNLRSAIDILFLCGSSDTVVAKQAILLYYLFDRLWKIPDDKWRSSVDDFSATFNIARHSILESFTFYLLDDPSDDAMKEACRLLPEISGPTTHPKVAQTLLERQNPDTALMVLRWSGSDSGPELASLNEVVTAVRVRVECGLLIEAFMYQRSVCTKVKKKKARHELSDALNGLNNDFDDGLNWLEILVTEICLLCIRRSIVDRIIGLPWNVDEEKHLHKCLFDYALEEPFTNGSLLVVFYLQRYRYVEAYQVDQKLQSLEGDFISKDLVDDNVKNRIVTTQQWRAGLVAKGIQLLPEVEQEKVKSGQMTELTPPENPNPGAADRGMSNLVPSDVNSSLIFQMGVENPPPESNFGGLTNFSTPVSKVNKFGDADRGMSMLKSISKNFKFDDIITKSTTPVKEFTRGSSRIKKNKYIHNDQNESVDYLPNSSPNFGNIAANFEDSPGGINSLIKSKASGKSARLSRLGMDADVDASADLMDMTWSNKDESLPVQTNMNGGPRWRSDDADDYEDQQNLDGPTSGASFNLPSIGLRRSRRTRR